MILSGWVVLDKPLHMSSAQALNEVKHFLKKQGILGKIGHAGTLDPLATGVLPIALGEATKTVSYIQDTDKEYIFTVTWGEERLTDDAEGQVVSISAHRPTQEDILNCVSQFMGEISQVPPQYSALKIEGKRSYERARRGEIFVLNARLVKIHELRLIDVEKNAASFWVKCGKGTYIRSLARDMGRLLHSFGYVSFLRRLRVGNFDLSQSILLDNLIDLVHKEEKCLVSLDKALVDIPALILDEKEAKALSFGQKVLLSSFDLERNSFTKKEQTFLIKSTSGVLIGIANLDLEGSFLTLKRGFKW